MRFGWAIQSSWTNGVRWKLTCPICATYKLQVYTPLRLLSTAGNVSRYLFTTYSNLEKL
jgi:hypothetical protein